MKERPHLDNAAYFLYTGQEDEPDGVICVRVHPSVRVIHARAFHYCSSLHKILIPPAIRAFKDGTFPGCLILTVDILGDGLEEIGDYTFF